MSSGYPERLFKYLGLLVRLDWAPTHLAGDPPLAPHGAQRRCARQYDRVFSHMAKLPAVATGRMDGEELMNRCPQGTPSACHQSLKG